LQAVQQVLDDADCGVEVLHGPVLNPVRPAAAAAPVRPPEQRVQEPARAAGFPAPQLLVVYSPYRKLYGPLVQVVSDLQRAHPDRNLAVLVPELVPTRWYHYLLHNQTATLIKAYLLFSGFRRVVVINVPWYLSA
jgi:hypothetical protein